MARAQKKSAKAVLSDAAKALMEEASAFNYQRKAAMAWARGVDHAGDVEVKPTQDFDLNRTIFTTLEGNYLAQLLGRKFLSRFSGVIRPSRKLKMLIRRCVLKRRFLMSILGSWISWWMSVISVWNTPMVPS